MKKYLLLIGLALALPTMARATIVGSAHDFSLSSWNTNSHGVCSPCHTPHKANSDKLIPLWKHYTTAQTFTPYASSTLNASVGQPNGVSKACLSCHDGVTAINQTYSSSTAGGRFTGGVTNLVTGGAAIGLDLSRTHPVSFTYSDSSSTDPYIFGSSHTLQWGAASGGTIASVMLHGGVTMECTSCHDVHAQKGDASTSSRLLIVDSNTWDADGRGSTLCRTCHDK